MRACCVAGTLELLGMERQWDRHGSCPSVASILGREMDNRQTSRWSVLSMSAITLKKNPARERDMRDLAMVAPEAYPRRWLRS